MPVEQWELLHLAPIQPAIGSGVPSVGFGWRSISRIDRPPEEVRPHASGRVMVPNHGVSPRYPQSLRSTQSSSRRSRFWTRLRVRRRAGAQGNGELLTTRIKSRKLLTVKIDGLLR